jgi:hypothetical protein
MAIPPIELRSGKRGGSVRHVSFRRAAVFPFRKLGAARTQLTRSSRNGNRR